MADLAIDLSNWPTYDQVTAAKFDFAGFTVYDCLIRDSKFTSGKNDVIMGALPCSVDDLGRLEAENGKSLSDSLAGIKEEQGFRQIYMITKIQNDEAGEMFREVVIYPKMDEELKNYLLSDGNLKFEEVSHEGDFSLLKYFNMKLTRKYVLPVVAKFYE